MALRKEETLTKSVAKTASSHMLSFLLPDLSKLRWIVRPRIGKSDPIAIKTVRNHRQPRWASTRARASCSTAKLDDAPAWFFCEETSVSVIVELLNYPRSFRDERWAKRAPAIFCELPAVLAKLFIRVLVERFDWRCAKGEVLSCCRGWCPSPLEMSAILC